MPLVKYGPDFDDDKRKELSRFLVGNDYIVSNMKRNRRITPSGLDLVLGFINPGQERYNFELYHVDLKLSKNHSQHTESLKGLIDDFFKM